MLLAAQMRLQEDALHASPPECLQKVLHVKKILVWPKFLEKFQHEGMAVVGRGFLEKFQHDDITFVDFILKGVPMPWCHQACAICLGSGQVPFVFCLVDLCRPFFAGVMYRRFNTRAQT